MQFTIFEPEASGHHMILHTRHIFKEAMQRGWQLHLVTSEKAMQHPAYQPVRAECGNVLRVSTMRYVDPPVNPNAPKLLRYQYAQYRAFVDAYQRLMALQRPDVIYVVNLDYLDKVMAIMGSPFGRTPFAGMLMSVKFHHRTMGVIGPDRLDNWLQKRLFDRMLRIRTLRALTTINRPLFEFAQQYRSIGYDKIRYTPDLAALHGQIDRPTARKRLGIRDEQIVILVYGELTERKGIRELLHAVRDSNCPEIVSVLLAGRPNEVTLSLLNESDNQRLCVSGRLITLLGFLNDEQEYLAFRAADIVWLGYRDFYGMSGVLVQAGMMQLPIIACREGIIGWMARQHKLGEVIDVTDHMQLVGAISKLVMSPELRFQYGSHGASMAQHHTAAGFANAVCDAVAA